jgi:hypothetical protein
MIRKWASKFRKTVNKRTVSRRREFHLPIVVSFVPDRNTGSLHQTLNDLAVRGETRDLSATGIGFVVSSIRLREYYLVGEERLLNAELKLPKGKVKMQIVGQRYNQIGQHVSATQYLVGAKIVQMSDVDRETYKEFLRQKKRKVGALEFGIDEG